MKYHSLSRNRHIERPGNYISYSCWKMFSQTRRLWLFGLLGGKRAKKKIIIKNNNCICHASYLRNSVAYDHNFCYICVKWWYLQACFSFFKILIFGVFRWGTHLYMSLFRPSVHLSVLLSVAHHISGTIHHLIIIFGIYM